MEFKAEWIRASERGVPRSLQERGGARRVREIFLPGLNETVDAAAEASDIGKLASSCIELAVNLAVTRNDNDGGGGSAPVPAVMIAAYEAATHPSHRSDLSELQ